MRLTKKFGAVVLALALLISCLGVFTVSAATDTVMNLVSFRDSATGYASYDYSASYTDASWRMFFYGDASPTDINAAFGDYVVTWDNGGETGQSAVQLYPQNADNGIMWAVIWGVPAADALVDGATVKIAAGTGTTGSGNSITLARDVDMKWHADTQRWEYIAPAPSYTGNALAYSSSNAGSGFYASSADSIPYNTDWNYRYFPIGTQGEITLIRNGVETKLPNAYFQKIGASSYYINVEAGGTPVQAGDTIRISGIFGLGDWTKAWVIGWFPGTYVEIPEAVFDFDGSNWSAGYVLSDDAVVLTHLDVIAAHQSATAFYTSLPEGTTGLTIDNDWYTRFYPMTNQDGGFVNGTAYANRFALDGGGGMPIQSSAGAAGLYVSGFGTATEGTTVTIMGDFYGYNRNTGVMTGEQITLYAPVTFTYSGGVWTRTSEIPEIPVSWNYHDFTISGVSQVIENAATTGYRHFYLNINGEVPGDWDKFEHLQLAVNDGEKFGVRVGNNGSTSVICFDVYKDYMPASIDVGTTLTLYAGAATPAADAVNVNADDAIRLTQDCTLVWDGSGWVLEEDYNPISYTNLTITGAIEPSGLNTDSGRWDFYLSVDGTIPGVADSGYSFAPIKAIYKDAVGNTILEKNFTFTHAAHGNGTFFAYVEFTELTADALPAGSHVTFYAGKADPTTGSEGINITNDFSLEWNGSEWVTPDLTVYEDVALSAPENGWNAEHSWWDIYLTSDIILPGTAWETAYKDIVVEYGDGATANGLAVKKAGDKRLNVFFTSDAPAVGTKITIKAGKSKAYNNSTGVVDTTANGINIVSDYVMVWTGTGLVPAADYVVYNDLTLTGTVNPTGWSGSIWNFYLSVDGTIPGVGDSGYYFTPAYITVVDGNGNTLLNKFERNLAFAAHQTTLFFNIDASSLPYASVTEGTVLTIHSGKMDPISWESIARNEDGYQIGINVQNDLVLVWDGASWINYLDRSGYTVYEGSVSTKGAEVDPSTPPHLYLQGSDTLDAVMKDVATDWNIAYVYPMLGSANGVFLNGTKISVSFQKYSGGANRWYMGGVTPSAEGDTLVIKGQFYNDTYQVIVDLAPLTLVWNGTQWVQQIIATVEKDVNGDGEVDIRDAILLQMHLADTTVVISNMSDINESGSVTSDDQRMLRRYLLGIVVTYVNDIPVGTPYYAGGEMIKTAYIPPAIGTIDWDTETVNFKSDDEIDRLMDDYAAAGFTHINPESYAYFYDQAADWGPQQLLYRYFEEAEERGLKVIVSSAYMFNLLRAGWDIDTYDSSDATQVNYTNWRAVMESLVIILSEHPAFWGFMMADEPDSSQISNYVKVISYLHETYPSVGTYWANYPSYASSSAVGGNYTNYVTSLGAGTGQFMYDSYCLVNKDTWYGSSDNYIDEYWFSNLNTVATLGRDNNFTSGITMQSTALTPTGGNGLFANTYQRRQILSDADIGFQVYTALAYGFKELSYFTYSDHPSGTSASVVLNTSMVGTDLSTKNAAYYAVKNTHAEIKDLEAALVNYNWLGTIELNLEDSDDKTSTYTAANNDRLASVSNASGALVIGCMKDVDGYDGYMVANASEPSKSSTSSVTLTFNNATKALVYVNGVAREVTLTNGAYTVSVADGEGVFIIPILEG